MTFNDLQLHGWVIEKISNNRGLKGALMHLHNKSERTIMHWLATNYRMLCIQESLDVIAAWLRIDQEALTENRIMEPTPQQS